jgi:hypothetical protein
VSKNIRPIRDTPQNIETIINSFEKYALGDILCIQEKPIATFILAICFIEQLSGFLFEFEGNDGNKPEWFFKEYMPEYQGINLYHKARHTLVHNYSSRGQFDIDNRGLFEDVPYVEIDDVIHINTNVFVHYLIKVFEKAKKAMLESRNTEGDYTTYKNALKNSMYYPVLVDTAR